MRLLIILLIITFSYNAYGKKICKSINDTTKVCYKITDILITKKKKKRKKKVRKIKCKGNCTIRYIKEYRIQRKSYHKEVEHNIKLLFGGSKSLQKQGKNKATLQHEADMGIQLTTTWSTGFDTSILITKEQNAYFGIGLDF